MYRLRLNDSSNLSPAVEFNASEPCSRARELTGGDSKDQKRRTKQSSHRPRPGTHIECGQL